MTSLMRDLARRANANGPSAEIQVDEPADATDRAAEPVAAPDRIAEKAQAPKVPSEPTPPTILAVAGEERIYRIANHEPVLVSVREHAVLQAFLDSAILDMRSLEEATRVRRPERALADLTRKYGGIFAPAIRLPGARDRGGYHVKIRWDDCPEK